MPTYASIADMFKTIYTEMQVTNLRIETMANEVKRLADEVARQKTVNEGATTFIAGLQQQLIDLANSRAADQANAAAPGETAAIVDEINKLADQLGSQTDALAKAFTANTPAEGGGGGGGGEPAPAPTPPTPAPDTNADLTQPPATPGEGQPQ